MVRKSYIFCQGILVLFILPTLLFATFSIDDVGRQIIALQDKPLRGLVTGSVYTITEVENSYHAKIDSEGSGKIMAVHEDDQWAFTQTNSIYHNFQVGDYIVLNLADPQGFVTAVETQPYRLPNQPRIFDIRAHTLYTTIHRVERIVGGIVHIKWARFANYNSYDDLVLPTDAYPELYYSISNEDIVKFVKVDMSISDPQYGFLVNSEVGVNSSSTGSMEDLSSGTITQTGIDNNPDSFWQAQANYLVNARYYYNFNDLCLYYVVQLSSLSLPNFVLPTKPQIILNYRQYFSANDLANFYKYPKRFQLNGIFTADNYPTLFTIENSNFNYSHNEFNLNNKTWEFSNPPRAVYKINLPYQYVYQYSKKDTFSTPRCSLNINFNYDWATSHPIQGNDPNHFTFNKYNLAEYRAISEQWNIFNIE